MKTIKQQELADVLKKYDLAIPSYEDALSLVNLNKPKHKKYGYISKGQRATYYRTYHYVSLSFWKGDNLYNVHIYANGELMIDISGIGGTVYNDCTTVMKINGKYINA